MRDCWETQPELRPSFSELVTRLSSHLVVMADYLDFSLSAGDFSVIANGAVDTFESTAIESAMIAEEPETEMDSPVVIISNKRAESDAAMDSQSAIIEAHSSSGTEDGLVVVDSAYKTATFDVTAEAEECSVILENAADAGAIESGVETEKAMDSSL